MFHGLLLSKIYAAAVGKRLHTGVWINYIVGGRDVLNLTDRLENSTGSAGPDWLFLVPESPKGKPKNTLPEPSGRRQGKYPKESASHCAWRLIARPHSHTQNTQQTQKASGNPNLSGAWAVKAHAHAEVRTQTESLVARIPSSRRSLGHLQSWVARPGYARQLS